MREIELKPSRWLGMLLLAMLGLALAAIAMAAIPVGLRVLLAVAAVAAGAWGWRRCAVSGALRIAIDGHLHGLDDSGEWSEVEVLDDSFVSPAVMVLRYRSAAGRAQALTLLPDSASAADLRRLRVALRWGPRRRSDTGSPDAG